MNYRYKLVTLKTGKAGRRTGPPADPSYSMTYPTLDDFKVINDLYFSYKTDGFELCLEPCLNGYDVALYDLDQDLIYFKECTNLTGVFTSLTAYGAAREIFIELLDRYERDKNLQTDGNKPLTRGRQ